MIGRARRTRAALLFISAAAYIASFNGVGDRLDAADGERIHVALSETIVRERSPSVAAIVRRDPFMGAPDADVDVARETTDDGGLDVPDVAGTMPAAQVADQKTEYVVRATIVGAHPVAYVSAGDDLEIVRAHDVIAGHRIRAIDVGGIVFTDGTRLDLSDVAPEAVSQRVTFEPPERRTMGIRRLPTVRDRSRNEQPAPAPVAPPTQAAPQTTTPAPLRTVDPRGLPVGTTPTPDVTSPTSFPYPYPYAPAPH